MREIKFRFYDPFNEYMDYSKSLPDFFERYNQTIKGDNRLSELMQYTNLKDRTGKEIYEGDIIQYSNSKVKKSVIWWDGAWYFKRKSKRDHKKRLNNKFLWFMKPEIIGNIYENPNLLKED